MQLKKTKKKLLTEIFSIFECLVTQNPSNQDSQLTWFFQIIWKTVRKSRNMGLLRMTYAWKWFQNLLHSKSHKMAEKLNFVVFGALFLFDTRIQQRWYLAGRNSSWSVIRRMKTEHFTIMKKSTVASQKCKNILLQAALKDFWLSANPKLKN